MARKYNLDEQIAEGDPLHPETHEAIAEAVNDLDDRTADIETDLTTRLSPTKLNATIASLSSSVNVRSYGAVGDGVSDDTLAVIAAINSAPPPGGCPVPTGDVSGQFEHY